MGRRHAVAAMLLAACKAELADTSIDAAGMQIDASMQTSIDAASPDAQIMLGPWGAATAIPGANTTSGEDDCTLSSNKLELYFKRSDSGNANLYVMTRASVNDPFGAPTALTILNSSVAEESPRLSSNDLTMYFGRDGDIYKTTRTSTTATWMAPSLVTTLSTTGAYEKWAAVCDDGYAIVSRSTTSADQDLFAGTITAGATTALTDFNSPQAEQGTLLSDDCLRVYFQSSRDGNFNMYVATRLTTSTAWTNPTALSDFNTATFNEEDPWISRDQRTFVFASNSGGDNDKDLYISTR